MDERIRYIFSAETQSLVKEFGLVDKEFDKLNKSGLSLKKLETIIEDLFDRRKLTESREELGRLNRALRELRGAERGLKEVGIPDQLSDQTRRARISVNSLNQVVRDLPFGFIAISNNLPILFDQFAALRRESNGTRGALIQFGRQLIGPAGIALAFSAVTGIVTSLIQKYGSLGAAIDALFSKNSRLFESQRAIAKEFAKSTGEVAVQQQTFSNIVSQLDRFNKRTAERKLLVEELNSLYGEYLGNLDAEKVTTAALVGIQGLLRKAVVETNRAKLIGVEISKLQGELDLLTSEGVEGVNRFGAAFNVLFRRFKEGLNVIGDFFKSAIQNLPKNSFLRQIDEFLDKSQVEEFQFRVDSLSGTLDELKRQFNLSDNEARRLRLELDRLLAQYQKTEKGTRPKPEKLINPDLDFSDSVARLLRRIEAREELTPEQISSLERYAQFFVNEAKGKIEASDLLVKLKAVPELDSTFTSRIQKAFEDGIPKTINVDALQNNLQSLQQFADIQLEQLREKLQTITAFFQNVAQPIVEGFVEALVLDGPNAAIERLTENIGKLLIRLAQAAVEAAILQGILAVLAPGAGAAAGGFFGIFQNILGFGRGGNRPGGFGGLFPSLRGAANLSGLTGGGINVNVTGKARGSDLVFVNNRSLRNNGRGF